MRHIFAISALLILFAQTNSFAIPNYDEEIKKAAKISFLDPYLIKAIIKVESNFNHKAMSHKGAMGLMQVMPSTADSVHIHDPLHPTNNLVGASKYLRKLINRYKGNIKLALAAYNAGPSAVAKYKGIPPYKETKNYVKKVMKYYKDFKKE